MNTKIRHFPEIGRTYAVRSIHQDLLDQLLVDHYMGGSINMLALLFGEARLHPLDKYCKKSGRETAVNNIKSTMFQLAQITIQPQGTYFTFVKGELEVHLYKSNDKDYAELSSICP